MLSARPTATRQPLHCPIPPRLSPHAEPVQRWLGDWLADLGAGLPPEVRHRVGRAGFARYAARLYPDADIATLRCLSSLFTWFFLLDDMADSTDAPDPSRLRKLFDTALEQLQHADTTTHADPLSRILAQAWQAPRAAMPPSWCDRFIDAVQHHLDGVVREAEAKAADRRPSVDDYVLLRRATSAAYVAHVLGEYAAGCPLPGSVHGHPAVQAYSTAANDLLSWFNDLLSLTRDEATAGGHNLVLALAAERGLSAPDAVDAATVMWRERMAGFAGLRAAVPSFGPMLDPAVQAYLRGIERSVRGTIDWSLESVRYRAPDLVVPYLLTGGAPR